MSNIILVILLLILLILYSSNIKFNYELLDNTQEANKYFKYVFGGENYKKYDLYAFSQLNFDLQKKILEKLTNNFSSSENETNYYKKIIDTDSLQKNVELGSRYIPINDLLFAVRSNRILDPKILSYKPHLLFDNSNVVNYSVLNKITPLPKSKLSLYKDILLLTVPDDKFNINNKNTFETPIIKDNKISFKNIELIQIDDLPISLIKLTDSSTNITIEKVEATI